jgi:hypothetical protein
MSCDFNKELLRLYSLECLDDTGTASVQRHLESCTECRTRLAVYQNTIDLLSGAFDEEAPDWLLTKTMANVRSYSKPRFVWGIPMIAGSAVAILVLVFSLKMYQPSGFKPLSPRPKHEVADIQTIDAQETYDTDISLLNELLVGSTDSDNVNPVDDRSIYESLDVAPEVARLLL